jgi:hypothetical protein
MEYFVQATTANARPIKATNLDAYFQGVQEILGYERLEAQRRLDAGETLRNPHVRFFARALGVLSLRKRRAEYMRREPEGPVM